MEHAPNEQKIRKLSIEFQNLVEKLFDHSISPQEKEKIRNKARYVDNELKLEILKKQRILGIKKYDDAIPKDLLHRENKFSSQKIYPWKSKISKAVEYVGN